ncbi:uncharacterized protein LOC121513556 [Cheilinus undulatus]|uniref:uncharacterized protein LOC121513556 n=1 Tax=Cheilinus undulatus TaxID=241271 RepID=UPI001BD386A7|nr:uncharacterized protein LOC121513556 [Cheilinus undulatus]
MRKTFMCDETMIITIPIGCLKDANQGELMPEKFQCVYKDSYKVFTIKGKPKPLGAAQAITGVFIVTLWLIFGNSNYHHPYDEFMLMFSLPSVVYVLSGLLSFAAGRSPNMHVTKLSFSFNIISLCWSIAAIGLCALWLHMSFYHRPTKVMVLLGVNILILTLLVVEKCMAIFLIYWLSKAVCREHFNTLPIVLLKQGDRMRKTFVCDETMIITIPIGCLKDANQGELMPEKFQCVYKDSYKVFTIKGKPKPLGAAQAITGVFIVTLGLIFGFSDFCNRFILICTLPSVVYVLSGLLSFAAGLSPNMHVAKLSFSLNIISLCWSIPAIIFCIVSLAIQLFEEPSCVKLLTGVDILIMALLVVEKCMAIFLIYWLSKAVCREHFNTLPIVLLKQGE